MLPPGETEQSLEDTRLSTDTQEYDTEATHPDGKHMVCPL